jgi:hypothetical protein
LEKEWFNLGQKGLPSKPLMSQYNMKSLKTTDGKRLSTQKSLPAPPHVNQIFQVAPTHSPVQYSHGRKRLKTESHHALDKGKVIAAPSSPSNDFAKFVSSRMHLRDDCSRVISEIRPKGSTQSQENSEKSKGDSSNKGKIASQSGKYGF